MLITNLDIEDKAVGRQRLSLKRLQSVILTAKCPM